MMGHKLPMRSGDELDAFTGWKNYVYWKPGERKGVKKRFLKRERRVSKLDLRKELQMAECNICGDEMGDDDNMCSECRRPVCSECFNDDADMCLECAEELMEGERQAGYKETEFEDDMAEDDYVNDDEI